MSEWRDIESAPKDGRRVRLFIPFNPEKFTEAQCTDEGYWEPIGPAEMERVQRQIERGQRVLSVPRWGLDQGGCWRFDGDDGGFDIQPTKWMPLPDPPTSSPQTPPPA